MSNSARHQDGGGRGPNPLTTWLMLLLTVVLSASAQRRGVPAYQRRGTASNTKVTYAEVHKLMPECYPNDTCSVARDVDDTVHPVPYFCHCAEYCTRFGSCCVDSPYRDVVPEPQLTPHSCVQVYQNRSMRVFMIDRCKRNWDDEYIRDKCLGEAEKNSDPLLLIPVTNKRSGITYKNFFCSVCNGDDLRRDMVFWHMGVFLEWTPLMWTPGSITKSELKRLRYKSDAESGNMEWQIEGGDRDRTGVRFELDIPSSIAHLVKSCRKHVTTCADDWTDDVTRAQCGSYMAMVGAHFGPTTEWLGTTYKRFRNIHCAICNRVPLDLLECVVVTGADPGAQGRTPFNVGMLVDINRSDGDVPGRRRRCRNRQIYDPIRQTCIRSAGCFAGYVPRGGECVRATSG